MKFKQITPKQGGCLFNSLLLVFFFLLIGVVLGFYFYNQWEKPVFLDDQIIELTIEKGSSVSVIAKQLAREGIIQNAFLFRLYVKYRNVGKSLKAGVYTFTGSLTPELVLQKLVTGENQMMRLTIREGLKLSETIELLKESQLLDSSSAEQIITNMTPFDWQISHDTMEGILFPETYFYSKVTTVKQVIAMMTHGFKQTLPDQLADKLRAKGLKNLNELLTLASIVEKEAVISSERGTIASVYLNRLKKGMLLQSDPTVLYSLGKWKERVLYKDLEIDSPWNTYKYKGLPPTPICSPGKASILAVLNAPETEFLYFVATADGSGAHQFSKNLTGHNKNVQEFRKNRKKNNSK